MFLQLQSWFREILVLFPSGWRGWLAFFSLIALAHWAYFVGLPSWAIVQFGQTRPEGLRRYLEWVLATPSLLDPGHKLMVRSALASTYLVQGRHAEAVALGRANLAVLTRARSRGSQVMQEAHTRRLLADSLEALGQVEEAAKERQLAEESVARAPVDFFQLLTRGKFLERENRHAEACEVFEQAWSSMPQSMNRAARLECLAQLYLASHNAGRPVECLQWAEQAIALGADGRILRGAHRMAGIACGNLGRLEEAEFHTQQAYENAADAQDQGAMGEILGSLAEIQRKLGNLTEAHELATKAAQVAPKAIRMSCAVQSQILRQWGRYDEALAMLRRYGEGLQLPIPAMERRVRAACALDMSRIEAESGRADQAWIHIQEAVAELGTDARLGLKCDAAAAWVFAVRGLPNDSRRVADEAATRLPEFNHDPSTCRGVLFDLGMAAWVRGDHEDGAACWTSYLDLGPDPVHQPTALYVRGECRRHQGDMPGARADFRAANELGIDTHHARLAAQRLRELPLE